MLDFIEKAKANIELKEVTPELLRAFISRIEVYESLRNIRGLAVTPY